MLDIKTIKHKFMHIAQLRVGEYLSKGGVGGDVPAVIDARSNRAKPPYPYITVDIADITDDSQYSSHDFIDEVTGEETHEVPKVLMISYRCYGGEASSSNNALSQFIMGKLKDQFILSSVRNDIEDSIGATVQTISRGLDTRPIRLKNKELETASFDIDIHMIDVVSDPDTFIIENIDGTLRVYPLQGDEDNYIDTNVNVTDTTP